MQWREIFFLFRMHEWTTWSASGQIFQVIQKIKEGAQWKLNGIIDNDEDNEENNLKDEKIEKEDLWRMRNALC